MFRYVGRCLTHFVLCFKLTITLSALLLIGACGKLQSNLPAPSSLLSTVTTDYPGVGMVVLPNGAGLCTGTVVGERVVLTAAHCLKNSGTYSFMMQNGNSVSVVRTSTKYAYGPGVVDDPHDIGLLVFSSQVAPSDQIYKIGSSVASGDVLRLVGYGCNNLNSQSGAGVKRTGTNMVASIDSYINFLTPSSYAQIRILGPSNRAGSCFGDSGGPVFKMVNQQLEIVGVTHAGGNDGTNLISEYVNVATQSDNRAWLSALNSQYQLGIQGL